MSEEMKAYKELEQAAGVFQTAIAKFKKTFDPNAVGLNEWIESINETLDEIETEVEATEE